VKPQKTEREGAAASDVILAGTIFGTVSVACLVGGSVKHLSRNGKFIGIPTKAFGVCLLGGGGGWRVRRRGSRVTSRGSRVTSRGSQKISKFKKFKFKKIYK